jgi:FecR protein
MIARILIFAATSAAMLLAAAGTRADSIGDVVSVVPQASYQRNGAVQELLISDLLEQNDHVITTGDGSAYIHFIDDTVLTVGANSEVVLDKFVFDGDKAKTAVIQITRGTLRFVTGSSDHSAYQLKTPVATIGVRGTTIDLGYENERMIYNTVEGVGVVCHSSAGCRDVRAGESPLAIHRGGFALATPAEAARMLNRINRSHTILAQRIGRNPGNMLAFARDRGRIQGVALQKGLGPKGFGKGLGPKGFEQKGLGQKPGFFQRFNQRFAPGRKEKRKDGDQR